MAERVRVREIDDDEGKRLLRTVRRSTGSVVTWRRAQMVLLSAQGMSVTKIAEVTFTSVARVRDVVHNFNADGFEALCPKYRGRPSEDVRFPSAGRSRRSPSRSRPSMACRFRPAAWPAGRLPGRRGGGRGHQPEGLRVLLREEGVSFQRVKTWKTSRDPDYAAKKARIEHLYAISDGEVLPEEGAPEVVFCPDEFGPLNLQPRPGRQWAEHGGRHKDPDREPRPRRRATYTRTHGVRHLFAAYDLGKDRLYGHIKKTQEPLAVPGVLPLPALAAPLDVRIAIVCDNYSPHLTTKRCQRVGTWAVANNVEIAYTDQQLLAEPHRGPFTALRYFALDGTDHASHKEQGSMIRRYIIRRRGHADDRRLRTVVARANVA